MMNPDMQNWNSGLIILIGISILLLVSLIFSLKHQRKLHNQLDDSEVRFQALIESAHDAIIVTDIDGAVVQWNSGAERLFGYTKSTMIGTPIFTVVPKQIQPSYKQAITEFLKLEDSSNFDRMIETLGLTSKGREFPIEVSIGTWTIREGRFISFILRDITDRKLEEAQLKDLIYLDDLTGLPNRRMFKNRLHSLLARSEKRNTSFALLYLDLDNFKQVNDQHGHLVGDELLIQLSTRIYKKLGLYDTLARTGGDEFLFLLADKDEQETKQFVEWLSSSFETPFEVEGKHFTITCSIGISMYPKDGIDADRLLRNADTALYQVKAKDKNGYRFYSRAN